MPHEILDFVARIAWPSVALTAIVILGPFGVLKTTLGEVAVKLFGITSAVHDFKIIATDFHKTQEALRNSTGWVDELQIQLHSIAEQLESLRRTTQDINITTQDLAITEGSRSLAQSVESDGSVENVEATLPTLSVDQMYDDIRDRWYTLTEQLKSRVGAENFDARSIGAVARRHVDGRRARPLTLMEADRFERLHSQMKRFNRLQSTRHEWLTHEVYSAFIKSVEQATASLSAAKSGRRA